MFLTSCATQKSVKTVYVPTVPKGLSVQLSSFVEGYARRDSLYQVYKVKADSLYKAGLISKDKLKEVDFIFFEQMFNHATYLFHYLNIVKQND